MSRTVPTLPEEQYERNFAEIAPPLTPDAAFAEASRCLYCYDAPCTRACPTHIDVPAFIKKIATGNLRGSARVILDANPMGHSCARACPVEVLCEGACVLNERDAEPIAIALLQRHATDYALAKRLKLFAPGPPTGKRVAIVGAGPAGLSCAQDLRRFGHAVTVLDAKPLPGGLNTYGIAQYKMRPDTSLAEIGMILELGVELRAGVTVGRDLTFAQLAEQFDAVFIGVGLGGTGRLGISGEDQAGVVDALTFIERLKTRPYREVPVGRQVIVVGAGNTAIDAATQAKRLGAERVTIVYRRSEAEMPAYRYEYELAKADGCEFRWLTQPTRIMGNGQVEGVECVRMRLGEPDAGGRPRPMPVPESEHVLPADMVIGALGQEPHAELLAGIPGVRLERGRLPVDPATGRTANPKFFAGGDCTSGGAEIVHAAAEGRRAAAGINHYLGGGSTTV